jgi:hypothetical protein
MTGNPSLMASDVSHPTFPSESRTLMVLPAHRDGINIVRETVRSAAFRNFFLVVSPADGRVMLATPFMVALLSSLLLLAPTHQRMALIRVLTPEKKSPQKDLNPFGGFSVEPSESSSS